jgi:hypothetical protein
MTDAAPPLIEPMETAPPPCGDGEDGTRAMLQRELEVLGELAELGLQVARTIAGRITAPAADDALSSEALAQEGMAFTRVSRAVRMAVLLQARLIQGLKDEGRKAAPSEAEDEGPVRWEVQWVDEVTGEPVRDEAEDRDERVERAEGEACERLDRDDIYADLMTRPKEELVARICEDLSLFTPLPLDGGEVGSGGDGSAALGPTGHPHPQPSGLLVYEQPDPHQGGRESADPTRSALHSP